MKGHNLALIASDERDLHALAADLRLRFCIRTAVAGVHIRNGDPWLQKISLATEAFGQIDALLLPIGFSLDSDTGDLSEEQTRALIETNLVAVILTISKFMQPMRARNLGVIVGFGSIAAVRGRRANVVYAAAKRALCSYFESVRHMLASTSVRVQLYEMGYIDTQQAFGRRLLFPKCSPEKAAEFIVANLHRDVGTRYFPRFWSLVTTMVRMLPWSIYKRLNI